MNDAFRSVRTREFPGPQEGVFLNAASWGLIPRSAAEEAAGFTLRRNRAHGFDLAELGEIQRRAKSAIATLLNVESREVTLAPNTSFGVNLAAALVGRGPPGSIVLSAGEFPANVFPWKLLEDRGFDVVIVPADELGRPREEALISALGRPDVRALAVSAVQFASGYRCDLARLGEACRARGVLFCVDAIQALGAVPLHPKSCHVDVLASGAQKWLCSPYGSGFAWIREELHDRLTPPMVSWLAMDGATRFEDMLHYELDWRSDGRKFELATLGLQDYLGMARSIEVMLELGVHNIRQHIHGLHQQIIDWVRSRSDAHAVTPLEADRRAGILSITHPRMDEAAALLAEEGVVISVREGALRFAPHYYNTAEEIAKVVRLLDEAAG